MTTFQKIATSHDIQRYIQSHMGLQENSQLVPISAEDANKVLDEIWKVLDSAAFPLAAFNAQFLQYRNKLRKLSLKLSITHDILPSALILKEVQLNDNKLIGSGSFADVFVGTYNGEKVALKRLRVYTTARDDSKQKRLFLRECLLWKNLIHENIVSFHGVSEDVFEGTVCMVIAWMDNGTLASYIAGQRQEGRLRGEDCITAVNLWLYQIANGLSYLHEEGLVHGDLHGGNVLVDDAGIARLADFGMALVSESSSYGYASIHGGGAIRWKAPELIDSEEFGLPDSRPTPQSDVFSFACMCIELYSGKPPMDGVHPNQVPRRYMKGLRSPRPELPDGGLMPDGMWSLTTSCWEQLAKDRPSSDEVVKRVAIIAGVSVGDEIASRTMVMEENTTQSVQGFFQEEGRSPPLQQVSITGRSEKAHTLATVMSTISLSKEETLAPEYESRRMQKSVRYGKPKLQYQADHRGRTQELAALSATPPEGENGTMTNEDRSQWCDSKSRSMSLAEIRGWLAAAPSDAQIHDLPHTLARRILSEAFELLTQREPPPDAVGIERGCLRRICMAIAKQYKQLPAKLLAEATIDETQSPHDGILPVIYSGRYKSKRVALRLLSMENSLPQADMAFHFWVFQRESLLRMGLRHRHVLELYGLNDVVTGPNQYCQVTPWTKTPNGTLRDYVQQLHEEQANAPPALFEMVDTWLYQVALGLEYIHSEGIVHGNLHASQVLLDDGPAPCAKLAGFERSLLADTSSNDELFEDLRGGGATRWTAPELFDPRRSNRMEAYPTFLSDVFSFALTVVETYSGQDPYPELAESEVMKHVVRGGRPPQPVLASAGLMSGALWSLVTRCWKHISLDRPPSVVVARILGGICKSHADIKRKGHKSA